MKSVQRRFVLGAGGAAAVLAIYAGKRLFADTPINLTLASPSGAELAADDNTLLVDIRRPEEWKQTGVIEGALLVTYTDPDSFMQAVLPHIQPGQKLALICRSGNRTSRASRQIAPLVDTEVVDVAGGMNRVLGEGYRPQLPTRAMGCQSC
ncbi:rhodanese-like domain-containing protein [Tropicibacter naphthalenivorans]|uniref:Molybdopterin biosynthesis protein MoeB n=1 Tax=Tropicibacter naphthalenivorans TaxID=441103 RepID=A0A0P1GZ38_9RHOB|nr:rhodanese-like domain-containing protein [Tropicibacter naphthalenivorans]CUH81438.1 molybdopterin biosynthesis protein MoeB [Tropicibacter naphthalenivorans]SMD00436.1 Rhodanese-related sulfurtransferase [Tropicibacter naphthalenivorans]